MRAVTAAAAVLLLCALIRASAQSSSEDSSSSGPLELLPAGTPGLSAADTQALLPAMSALLQAIKATPALSNSQDLSSWVPGLVTALTCNNATLHSIFPDLPIKKLQPLLTLLHQAAELLSKSSSSAPQPSQPAPTALVRHLTLTAAVFGTAAYLEPLAANPWDDVALNSSGAAELALWCKSPELEPAQWSLLTPLNFLSWPHFWSVPLPHPLGVWPSSVGDTLQCELWECDGGAGGCGPAAPTVLPNASAGDDLLGSGLLSMESFKGGRRAQLRIQGPEGNTVGSIQLECLNCTKQWAAQQQEEEVEHEMLVWHSTKQPQNASNTTLGWHASPVPLNPKLEKLWLTILWHAAMDAIANTTVSAYPAPSSEQQQEEEEEQQQEEQQPAIWHSTKHTQDASDTAGTTTLGWRTSSVSLTPELDRLWLTILWRAAMDAIASSPEAASPAISSAPLPVEAPSSAAPAAKAAQQQPGSSSSSSSAGLPAGAIVAVSVTGVALALLLGLLGLLSWRYGAEMKGCFGWLHSRRQLSDGALFREELSAVDPFTEPLPILAKFDGQTDAQSDAHSDAQYSLVGANQDPPEQMSRQNSLARVVVTPWTPRAAQL